MLSFYLSIYIYTLFPNPKLAHTTPRTEGEKKKSVPLFSAQRQAMFDGVPWHLVKVWVFIYCNKTIESLTSLAPAFLRSLMMGPTVFPLTIESSTNTTLLLFKFSVMAPNFLATASCRERVSGRMKDRPTYRFLQSTSANGIPDFEKETIISIRMSTDNNKIIKRTTSLLF